MTMDPLEVLPEVPDLGGEVEILSPVPVFNGPYSRVYRGKLIQNGQLVAVKVLNRVHGTVRDAMKRKVKRERRTWGILDHPNILPLYGFADDEELFQPFGALISPWLSSGDASRFLSENGHSMSFQERLCLWKDVIEGVHYLHSFNPGLIHGDLKPLNILIDSGGHARICDFGLVRIFMDESGSGMTTTTVHTGTERYLAYELVVAGDNARPTTASDIHAVGCIGLEFILSQTPYSAWRNNYGGAIFVAIREGIPPAKRPENLSSDLYSVWETLEHCWHMNPSRRHTAASLLAWLEEQFDFTEEAAADNLTVFTSPDDGVSAMIDERLWQADDEEQDPLPDSDVARSNSISMIPTILVPVLLGFVVPLVTGL